MKKLLIPLRIPLLALVLAQAVPVFPAPVSEATPATGCYPQYENEWVLPEAVCA